MAIQSFLQDPEAPPGAGVFQLDDGRAFRAYSPADAAPFLAQNTAAAAAPPPEGGGAPAVPALATDAPQFGSAWGQAAGSAPPQELGKVPRPPAPVASEPAPQVPQAVQRPAQVVRGRPGPSPLLGQYFEESGLAPEYRQEQADERRAAQAAVAEQAFGAAPAVAQPGGAPPKGMVAKSYVKKFEEAGAPYTNEDRAAYEAAAREETLAKFHTAQSQIERANADQARAQASAQKYSAEVRKRNEERENEIGQYMARKSSVEEEVDRASRREVDPNRFYHQTGILGVIASAVAQGLGAYGASLGKSANFAQQIIDSHVKNDVAAQVDQVQRLGTQANNKLSRLMRDHDMSLNEATHRLTQAQQALGDATALQVASAHRSADVRSQYEEWYAARQKTRLDEERKRVSDTVGKSQGTVTYSAAGGEGSGGGFMGTRFKNRSEFEAEAVRRAKDEGLTPAQVLSEEVAAARGKEVAGGGDLVKLSPRMQGMLSKDKTIMATSAKRAEQYGLKRDESGQWYVPSTVAGLWEWGSSAAGSLVGTANARAKGATRETLVDERASAAAQGAPGEQTMHEYRKQESTNNPWAIAEMLNEAERAGREQEKAVLDVAKHSRVTSEKEEE